MRNRDGATGQGESTIPLRGNDEKEELAMLADLIIPGKGEPIKHGCITWKGSKITHVGSAETLPERFRGSPILTVPVLMPAQKVSLDAILQSQQNPVMTGARCARDCMLLLNCGVTSVREMAGYGIQLQQAIDEGSLVGPSIYSANCIISPTGGHADVHTLHQDWYDDACHHGLPAATADGVADCLKVVRQQLRAGAKVIKICASGGVGSEMDNPIDQQFSDEEIKIIVEEAARAQRIVGAHCHGKLGIMAALKAGVKTIEHGSYLDEEAADLMLEKGATLVATRTIVEIALKLGKDLLTERGYAKVQAVAAAQWNAMKLAVKKGIPMATGCDIPGSIPGNPIYTYGHNGTELIYHVKAGMTPLQAIEAATANGPLTLGPQAPKTGQLKAGHDADFIALDANPLDDINVFDGPEHVTHVWKLGKDYKSPGHPVSSLRL